MSYVIRNMWSGANGPEHRTGHQIVRVFLVVHQHDGRSKTEWLPITWGTLPGGSIITLKDVLAVA